MKIVLFISLLLLLGTFYCAVCPFNFGVTDAEILALTAVTNTGPSVITGSVAVSAGSAIVGFPPGSTLPTPNNLHNNDAFAATAQVDATTAYNSGANNTCNVNFVAATDLGGMVLLPGTYCFSSSAAITGILTLDGNNNPNAKWVFKTGSTLTTASASSVIQTNTGIPCQVEWIVGSSATLGTGTTFIGNIIALSSITLTTGSSTIGRLWARTGAVTLDTNIGTIPPPALVNNVTIVTTTTCNTTNINVTTATSLSGTNYTTSNTSFTCLNCAFNNGSFTTNTTVCGYTTLSTFTTCNSTITNSSITTIIAGNLLTTKVCAYTCVNCTFFNNIPPPNTNLCSFLCKNYTQAVSNCTGDNFEDLMLNNTILELGDTCKTVCTKFTTATTFTYVCIDNNFEIWETTFIVIGIAFGILLFLLIIYYFGFKRKRDEYDDVLDE